MHDAYEIAKPYAKALEILNIPCHRVDVDEVHAFIAQVIENNQKALVLNVNVHCINLALRHDWLRCFLKDAQLIFCDGDGVRLGLKILGEHPPPKITYDRWIWQLAEFCEHHGFSFYFLGGRPGVAQKAAEKIREVHPGLSIVGTHDGYFDHAGPKNEEVISVINELKPDILILGLGMPKQEKWLSCHWKKLRAHIFLTGGAVFDYAAGEAKRAPAWMIRMHLEWLFRLSQEPMRLFGRYVLGNPYFLYRVFYEKMRRVLWR